MVVFVTQQILEVDGAQSIAFLDRVWMNEILHAPRKTQNVFLCLVGVPCCSLGSRYGLEEVPEEPNVESTSGKAEGTVVELAG